MMTMRYVIIYVFASPEFKNKCFNSCLLIWHKSHPKCMDTSILYTEIQSSTRKQIFQMVCD